MLPGRLDGDRGRIADVSAMPAVLAAHLLGLMDVRVLCRLFLVRERYLDTVTHLELVERDFLLPLV